jgi:hypothetical protein
MVRGPTTETFVMIFVGTFVITPKRSPRRMQVNQASPTMSKEAACVEHSSSPPCAPSSG